MNKETAPLRFGHVGDIVGSLDMGATTTFQAPDINVNFIKDGFDFYNEPTINSVSKTVENIKSFDPLMGLHSMNNSYSEPSSAMDFVKSGLNAVAVGSTIGLI